MTLVLQPQNTFTIVHQIPNHLDSATYYVRAVIRNAFTDETIDTVSLVDKGGQRFKYDWRVPADPSGQGFYISIVTSVYTDSGYTTKSENYGDDENTFLVQERVLIGQGGSGADVFDMRRVLQEELTKFKTVIKKLVKDETKKQDENKTEPEEPSRWDEVLVSLGNLDSAVSDLRGKKVDFTPVIKKIGDSEKKVLKQIVLSEPEEQEEVDLEPVIIGLQTIFDEISLAVDGVKDLRDKLNNKDEMMAKLEIVRSLITDPDFKKLVENSGPKAIPTFVPRKIENLTL